MKKKRMITMCIMICTLCMYSTQTIFAKKIKFGEYVTYNGKVEKDLPMGEGKLTIIHPKDKKMKPAIFEGVFEGWSATGTLYFYSSEELPAFAGEVTISISEDGNTITYGLVKGGFVDASHDDSIIITPKDNMLVTSTFVDGDIKLSSNTIEQSEQITLAKYNDFSPLSLLSITSILGGGNATFYKHTQYCLDGFELKEKMYYETAEFTSGLSASMDENTRILNFANGDNYYFDKGYITPSSLKKSYNEGYVTFDSSKKVLRFHNTKTGEEGVGDFPATGDEILRMLEAKEINKSGVRFFYNDLAKLFVKAKDGDKKAKQELETKCTIVALDKVKADIRKKPVASKLYEISKAYKTGNIEGNELFREFEKYGAMSKSIPISKDSALVWLRMAADVDTEYLSRVKDLEIEMGIVSNDVQTEKNDTKVYSVNASGKSGAAIVSEAKKLTKGGDYIVQPYNVTVRGIGIANLADGSIKNLPKEIELNATLEVIPFGLEGNTILITINQKGLPSSYGIPPTLTFSWSGKSVYLKPEIFPDNNNAPGLSIYRNGQPCGGLLYRSYEPSGWYVLINTNLDVSGMTSGLNKGMTRTEVEKAFSDLGGNLKFTRKSGKLDVYTYYWFGQRKRYNAFGTDYHYELHADQKYVDFYFDSQGKLVKWIYLL